MNRKTTAAFFVTAALGLGTLPAQAGPCSNEIAQFEQAVRQSSGNPNAGPEKPAVVLAVYSCNNGNNGPVTDGLKAS